MKPDALGWKRNRHVHEKSLPGAFPLRKAEGVGRAKREGFRESPKPSLVFSLLHKRSKDSIGRAQPQESGHETDAHG